MIEKQKLRLDFCHTKSVILPVNVQDALRSGTGAGLNLSQTQYLNDQWSQIYM